MLDEYAVLNQVADDTRERLAVQWQNYDFWPAERRRRAGQIAS
jgi:hypothetical protein